MAKNIGFDFDDVILDFTGSMIKKLNHHHGKEISRDELTSFNYIVDKYLMTGEQAFNIIKEFCTAEDHIHILPVPGAIETLSGISVDNNLHIITARSESSRDNTTRWIDKHLEGLFDGVHFTNFFDVSQKRRKKSEVCMDLGIEIFIDDSIDNAHDVSSVGIPVLLFDTPWNQTEELPPLVTRVHSWNDIEKEINNLL